MSADEPTGAVPPVVVKEHGSLAVIRLNRPRERNTLSQSTLALLEASFNELTARADITSVAITGTDDVFASGADIRELETLTPTTARDFSARGQRLFQKIADAKHLTIAAINGYCMGGALDLALACDIRIASPGAVFAHPGARLGIITGWGGTQRLPRLIGASRALEFFLSARRMPAEEALEIGLIHYLDEDPLAFAQRLQIK